MEFTLYYRGDLTPNGKRDEKHQLRRVFHAQLKHLWSQPPLDMVKDPGALAGSSTIGPFRFVPLVSEKLKLVAELKIVMLRPELPGRLVTSGGDIDNRLKTLFDSPRSRRNLLSSG